MAERSKLETRGNSAVGGKGGHQPATGLGNSPPPKGGSGIRPRPQGNSKPAPKK